jgi:putative phosphoribosyl transferase
LKRCTNTNNLETNTISIPVNKANDDETTSKTSIIEGNLAIPKNAQGIVIFAHGSGSNRSSPRNQYISNIFNKHGLATLLIDLLTVEEYRIDNQIVRYRFDIQLQAKRFGAVIDWVTNSPLTHNLRLGLFGASTGAAVALIAAAERPEMIDAIVSRSGMLDLVAAYNLKKVKSPILLIVGEYDRQVIRSNEKALQVLEATCMKELRNIQGATHLFEEPGKIKELATLATEWFDRYLSRTVQDHQ